jgi:plasmid stabilization system protein ParE
MTKIQYLPLFFEDLQDIYNYINNVLANESAAKSFIDDVEQAIISRSYFPKAYEPYKSKKQREYPYYRIYVGNYTIFYIVKEKDELIMEVHRIIYSFRNIEIIIKT